MCPVLGTAICHAAGTGISRRGNVVLSISKAAQETAYNELTNNKNKVPKSAAVAIDPKTGAIREYTLKSALTGPHGLAEDDQE